MMLRTRMYEESQKNALVACLRNDDKHSEKYNKKRERKKGGKRRNER